MNWIDTPFWMPSNDMYHAVHPVATVAELCLCTSWLVCSVEYYNEVWCSYPTVEADYAHMDVWDSDGWFSNF